MSYNIELPRINGGTADAKVSQMQSYIYRLSEYLNWALNSIETSSGTGTTELIVTSSEGSEISPEDAEKTFSSIKSLIIKSAEIVTAYETQMKQTFDGYYEAQSDFGVYSQQTNQTITNNSRDITQLFSNVQTINSDIAEIQTAQQETNAWIKTGLLGTEEGIDVYGIEIGQKTIDPQTEQELFNKYARFTANGIYFYTPGITDAVAWMTGNKLYITNAEITGTLKLGHYSIDTSSGLAFKWIGGV